MYQNLRGMKKASLGQLKAAIRFAILSLLTVAEARR
jgi:hypothetical protein